MQTVPRLLEQFIPIHYELTLTIDRPSRTFTGTVTVRGSGTSDIIRLHTKGLSISNVVVDGKSAKSTIIPDQDELVISQTGLQPGSHIVVVGFSGIITDSMHGLYPCYYTYKGVREELLATQFESHHAREVFPCIDEPAAKSTFDVTLLTEPDVHVLGNMPIRSQQESDGQLVTSFERTPRMSTYLVAWVIGRMQHTHASTKNGVEVAVWSTLAQPKKSLDFATQFAVRTLEFFDEYFGSPYPLPKADLVALPDFSSGAMENWGLTTYREVALLVHPDTSSVSSKQYVASVIAHELSHQWFGDLVTMQWWNDLWLNESFARLMENVCLDALHPEWNMWLDFVASEYVMAMRRDAIDGVQPVQVDVKHPDEISSLFDPYIVYAKGACLLRMLEQHIGSDAFREGLRNYFSKYAYANTVAKDLWDEMGAASGKDIASLMGFWISHPGYPVVQIERSDDSIVTLRQQRFFVGSHEPDHTIWPIPLAASNTALPIILNKTSETIALTDKDKMQLNTQSSSYYLPRYDEVLFAHMLEQVQSGTLDPKDRVQLLANTILLARAGEISHADLIPLIYAYEDEKLEQVWGTISLCIAELRKFVETDTTSDQLLRSLATTVSAKLLSRLGWDRRDNESEDDIKLRATAISLSIYGELPSVIEEARKRFDEDNLEAMDPELRSIIISSVVRHGDKRIVDTLLEQYIATQSSELQHDICVGITSTRDHDAIDTLLDAIKNPAIVRPQDVFRWFVYLIRGKESRDTAWQWMKQNWSWIEKTFGGDKSYDDFPRYAATGLSSRKHLDEYITFFEPLQSEPALSRTISLGISEIRARVEAIERDSEAVQKRLRDYKPVVH